MLRKQDRYDEVLWTVLRIVAGGFLIPHGVQKLLGMLSAQGSVALIAMFESKAGLVPGAPFVIGTGMVEAFGGLALAFGLLTRAAATAAVGILVGAMLLVNGASGFFWTKGGIEYPLLWAILCACFVVRGGGVHSIDARLTGSPGNESDT